MGKWYDLDRLSDFQVGKYSQTGEDLLLEYIFNNIGTESKYCVEIGVGRWECTPNTKYFREDKGWNGIGFEKRRGNVKSRDLRDKFNIKICAVTDENVNKLFKKYDVPQVIDLMSIDIDGQDFYIWKSLKWKPRVVIIEFNEGLGPDVNAVMKLDRRHWKHRDNTYYYGASISSFKKLGKRKGYTLLCKCGRNLVFIRDGILPEKVDRDVKDIHPKAIPESYKVPDPKNREWVTI